MISYAQNFEDVLLERCFKGIEQGFYIDVGACHPIRDSVTYWFYRRGWRGMNIDPADAAFHALLRYRPRDINIDAYVSDQEHDVDFFDSGLSGLSSSDPRLADNASRRGFGVTRVSKKSRTLTNLCAEHGVDKIEFLKIDAEGAEESILAGFDLARWRPQVIVMEAIDASTQDYSNAASAKILNMASYSRCYFDGLNDYFLAKEAIHLQQHFNAPVSVLDGAEKWSDRSIDVSRGSIDAIAWKRIFDLRVRQKWSDMSREEEVEYQCRASGLKSDKHALTEQFVQQIYVELLGRIPSHDEVQQWMGVAESQSFFARDFVTTILSSDEYCRKSLEWGGI